MEGPGPGGWFCSKLESLRHLGVPEGGGQGPGGLVIQIFRCCVYLEVSCEVECAVTQGE